MRRYDNTEAIGVNEIRSVFIKDFDWIFRAQNEADVGIDAQVEMLYNGNPTAKLLGLQIKSGESHFHFSEDYITYYISGVHYSYWINSTIPMILVVYLPKSEVILWEEISVEKVEKTNKRWKIKIPMNNLLDLNSKEKLEKIILKEKASSSDIFIFKKDRNYHLSNPDYNDYPETIEDAGESILRIFRIIDDLEKDAEKHNQTFEKISEKGIQNNIKEMINEVSVMAKYWNICAIRLDAEEKIFSQTSSEWLYAYHRSLVVEYITKGKVINPNEVLNTLNILPKSTNTLEKHLERLIKILNPFHEKMTHIYEARSNLLNSVNALIQNCKSIQQITKEIKKQVENT